MQMFDRIVKYYTMCVSQKGKPRQKANFIMKKACKFVSFKLKGYDICLFGAGWARWKTIIGVYGEIHKNRNQMLGSKEK